MSVKINVKQEFGIAKPIEVKQSNRNFRKTLLLQKALTKFEVIEKEGSSEAAITDAMLETQTAMITYLCDLLGVDEEKVYEISFNETMDLSIKLSGLVLNIKPEAAEAGEADLKA